MNKFFPCHVLNILNFSISKWFCCYLWFQNSQIFLSTKFHNVPIPTSPICTTKTCRTPQKKQVSLNIHNHHRHPLARFSNMKSKMETPTTKHSLHCPLLATQWFLKSKYSYFTHITNKGINGQKLFKYMISICF
jgi:hypothetical protein